jgi:hypothetical protein
MTGLAAGLVALGSLGLALAAWIATGEYWMLLSWGSYPLAGWYILHVRPGNRIGLILLSVGALFGITSLGLVAPTVFERAGLITAYLAMFLFLVFLLLFPSGRPATTVGRYFVPVLGMLALAVVAMAFLWPAPLLEANPAVYLAFLLVGFIDVALRWLRAEGVEALQMMWFAWAVGVVAMSFVLWTLGISATWLQVVLTLVPNVIPVAIAIAVTRHGLYGIDRVISRTVSYSLVTLVVVGTYAVVVTSVSRLLPDSGALPVAGATLAAAAVCLPVVRRVRVAVDRRFDRARFDAQQQVEAFAERMSTTVEADGVAADLLATVQRTLAPGAAGVWDERSRS